MSSPTQTVNNPPWWKERMVWLVIGLPLSAVLAGVATIFIAAHDPDDLVEQKYVKTGMAVQATNAASERAAQMGLVASLKHVGDLLEIRVNRQDRPGVPLLLTLVHPTQAELDKQIPLLHVGQGKYQARSELTGQGKRLIILEPADKSWRLRGEWHAPFEEETSLHAGAQNPSTRP